ncbi:MAG: metallophosphoesterase [Bacilli bacterium]|nr:metallophosphoesterase [Bacilli bacterium]
MKKILKIFITIIILIILLLLYSRFIGTIGLNTKEYTIKDNNISNDFDGIKIVHFSDIHYKRIITKDRIDKIINEINLINPDIVIFTGDLIDQDSEINEDDITYLKEVLSKINAKYGKYSVIGNHDYSIDIEILRSIYKESNFNLLENSYDIIYGKDNNKLYIGGISTGAFSDTVLNKMKYDEESYKIIILHEPDYTDEIISLNPNLILGGHSHDGQVNIPYLKKYFVPTGSKKYYDEHYLVNNTNLYISSGIGVSRYNFRLFNHPSINFYRINKN